MKNKSIDRNKPVSEKKFAADLTAITPEVSSKPQPPRRKGLRGSFEDTVKRHRGTMVAKQ